MGNAGYNINFCNIFFINTNYFCYIYVRTLIDNSHIMMLMKFKKSIWLLTILILSIPNISMAQALQLEHKNGNISIPLEELQQSSNIELTIYDPFLQGDVTVRGILLEDLLFSYLGYVPTAVQLYGMDDYQYTFQSWKHGHWVIATHENGKKMTVRQRGPLRVLEIDHHNKNVRNLREFNDWLWMLTKIEVLH